MSLLVGEGVGGGVVSRVERFNKMQNIYDSGDVGTQIDKQADRQVRKW